MVKESFVWDNHYIYGDRPHVDQVCTHLLSLFEMGMLRVGAKHDSVPGFSFNPYSPPDKTVIQASFLVEIPAFSSALFRCEFFSPKMKPPRGKFRILFQVPERITDSHYELFSDRCPDEMTPFFAASRGHHLQPQSLWWSPGRRTWAFERDEGFQGKWAGDYGVQVLSEALTETVERMKSRMALIPIELEW